MITPTAGPNPKEFEVDKIEIGACTRLMPFQSFLGSNQSPLIESIQSKCSKFSKLFRSPEFGIIERSLSLLNLWPNEELTRTTQDHSIQGKEKTAQIRSIISLPLLLSSRLSHNLFLYKTNILHTNRQIKIWFFNFRLRMQSVKIGFVAFLCLRCLPLFGEIMKFMNFFDRFEFSNSKQIKKFLSCSMLRKEASAVNAKRCVRGFTKCLADSIERSQSSDRRFKRSLWIKVVDRMEGVNRMF